MFRTLFSTRPTVAAQGLTLPKKLNQFRLHVLCFNPTNDSTREFLREILDLIILHELNGTPLVRGMFDLELLDSLIPYETENVLVTRDEYYALATFVGQVAIWQTLLPTPLLSRLSRSQIGILLSRFYLISCADYGLRISLPVARPILSFSISRVIASFALVWSATRHG